MELTPTRMERAVVIGASISGLLAARALANHFKQVIVVERDILPPVGEPRKGCPRAGMPTSCWRAGAICWKAFSPA